MMLTTLRRAAVCSGRRVRSAAHGLCGNRPWRRTLMRPQIKRGRGGRGPWASGGLVIIILVLVLDSGKSGVAKSNTSPSYLSQFGSACSGDGQFLGPYGIAVDSSGN